MEIWKPIKQYEGLYEVSNLGRIRSLDRITIQKNAFNTDSKILHKGQIIRPIYDKTTGYRQLNLYKAGKPKKYYVHRLVAETFCEHPEGYDYVDHKNGRKLDNRANNLRWVTQNENIQNAKRLGHDYKKQSRTGIYKYGKNIYCVELDRIFFSLYQAAEWIQQEIGITAKINSIRTNIHRACMSGRYCI